MRHWAAALTVMIAGPALADPPALVRLPASAPRPASAFRLKPVSNDGNPFFHINDPRSPLRNGYGGSMVDLFPVAGGNFHFSAGPRLFGRAGRPYKIDPESQTLLPAFRASGPKMSRRLAPAMLIGYGRTVDRGLAFGIDAGFIKGKITAVPDRVGRLNRARVGAELSRGRPESPMNQLVRLTALYRF